MAQTILIVDDVRENIDTLSGILGDGYTCIGALSAAEAKNTLLDEENSVLAVLLSLSLPEEGGFSVLSLMREDAALSQIPAVVITPDIELAVRALRMGALDCIISPYEAELVRSRVKNAVEQRALHTGALLSALNAIMEVTSDLSYVKDRELRYICASRASLRVLDIGDNTGIAGKTDYELFDRETADRFTADDRHILATGEAIVDKIDAVRVVDGVTHYSRTSKYPIRGIDGEIIGLYGVGHDVTGYREALDRLRLLTDSIPGGLATFEVGPGGAKMVYFNEGFCRGSGYSREEYAAMTAADPFAFVLEEDRPAAVEAVKRLLGGGAMNSTGSYRSRGRNGERRWFSMTGTVSERRGDTCVVNVVKYDITAQKELEQSLRLSERENRLAVSLSGNAIMRFDISSRCITVSPDMAEKHGITEKLCDVPYAQVRDGIISPESVDAYVGFFESLINGSPENSATFQYSTPDGWRWKEAHGKTVFSDAGSPLFTLISVSDVTDQMEKEAIFLKWQQSLENKQADTFSLFCCNLNRNASYDTEEGLLLHGAFDSETLSFSERAREYANRRVCAEDRDRYLELVNADVMLASYYRGKRTETLEYREELLEGGTRWLRLTIELVEHPNSSDVCAYLLYENINGEKLDALKTQMLAELDALTGILNRKAFTDRMENKLERRTPDTLYALMMLDLDGFKQINDNFGHAIGDETLIEVGQKLSETFRGGDLVGRLGGDEFVVCLCEMPSRVVVAKKAKQLCALLRKSFSIELQMSVSIGIAVCPEDGCDFETLYHKADVALYHMKATGKDGFVFYTDGMNDEEPSAEAVAETLCAARAPHARPKRRMLVVDDNRMNRELLINMFKDEFIIDTAEDGNAAIIRLRRYGSAISVVLLDLIMPGMDGFAVLSKMRENAELQTIPVVVVSGLSERETSLHAIKCGASDYVMKPVDGDLLRLRVESAISKSENERLRAENRYLSIQSGEVSMLRAILENQSTAWALYDRGSGIFTYDETLGALLDGRFDHRPLWDILTEDGVCGESGVKRLRTAMSKLASDTEQSSASLTLELKNRAGALNQYRVDIVKCHESSGVGERLALTFKEEREPDEKP